MNKTGYAKGRLNPIIYFENSDGVIILPPTTADARWIYDAPDANGQSFRTRKFEYKEAETLAAVEVLQKRLVEAEMHRMGEAAEHDDRVSAAVWKQRGSDLYARMISAGTSAFERDFLKEYLVLREAKRDRHRQRWTEATMYLDALEFDSNHKATDRIRD